MTSASTAAQLVAGLAQELEDTRVHRDAIAADTRKWDALTRTVQDICELSVKLGRDKHTLLEELAVKRRAVQLLLRERDSMRAELHAIDGTIGTVGKYGLPPQ